MATKAQYAAATQALKASLEPLIDDMVPFFAKQQARDALDAKAPAVAKAVIDAALGE